MPPEPRDGPRGHHPDYIARAEALQLLGVKAETLYSYVSRGQIRRVRTAKGQSRYSREDVERVKARSIARSGHGPAAAAAVHWGAPLLETEITEITAAGPIYRGRSAIEIARSGATFEVAVGQLWRTGSRAPLLDAAAPVPDGAWRQAARSTRSGPFDAHIRHLLAEHLLGIARARADIGSDDALATGAHLLTALTGTFGLAGPSRRLRAVAPGETIAATLASALCGAAESARVRAIDTTLIVLADHEFTPATFAARIAASAGADTCACVGAALNVHFGARFGLCSELIERYLTPHGAAPTERASVEAIVAARYDHPLYPDGDPRAREIIAAVERVAGSAAVVAQALADLAALPGRYRSDPTVDEALAVLARALSLPQRTASGLFALARVAGWIAHIEEQRRDPLVIRPRGKFSAPGGG